MRPLSKHPLNSHTKTMLKLTKGNAGLRQLLDLMKICVSTVKGCKIRWHGHVSQ